MTRVSERERPLQLQFVLSAPNVNDLPPTGSEIAVAGRSNVGKSSLINALANRNGLAVVSKTPGRTQLLNCFRVDDVPGVTGGATFVDLPGYGYAKAPGAVRARWGPMIEGYLLGRQGLRLVMVLVDAEVGPTRLDLDLLTWLQGAEVPYAVVATKFDKVKSSVRQRRKKELAAGCGLLPSEVTWVSAAKHTNIDLLRRRVREWLAEPSPSDG